MPLTIKEIENAKPREKKYKLADSGGLCLMVQPWGGKFWLWRYRFDGTEKNMTLGDYPRRSPSMLALSSASADSSSPAFG